MLQISKTVTKIFTFDSAHRLPDYDGKCADLHGHTYKLEITVSGNPTVSDIVSKIRKKKIDFGKPYEGMVCDFSHLSIIVNKLIIDKLDHKNLNSIFEIPTAENMVEWIFNVLWAVFEGRLKKVRLWETPTSYAEVNLESWEENKDDNK